MGCKDPISHFFTNEYFNTALVGPSLSHYRNISIWFLVRCLIYQKNYANHYHTTTSITRHPDSYNPEKTPNAA
jgi:TFIIF-interacting CTD phosphatase-like protein